MFGIEAEMQQGVVMLACRQDDVAAAAAIAAAGAAARNKFLAPKRKAAVAAVAGFDGDNNFVNEHGNRRNSPLESFRRLIGSARSGLLRNDVDELAQRPRSRNSTVPGTVANSVSSLPKPTFLPGL